MDVFSIYMLKRIVNWLINVSLSVINFIKKQWIIIITDENTKTYLKMSSEIKIYYDDDNFEYTTEIINIGNITNVECWNYFDNIIDNIFNE